MIRKAAALLALFLAASALSGAVRADFIYGGEAYAAFAPGVVTPPVADTGPLPPGGGALTAHLDNFSFMGVVTSAALDAQTMGLSGMVTSDASVARFHADLRPLNINFVADADLIAAHARADGTVTPFGVTGSAMFTNLVVNNMTINSQVAPNTMIDLGAVGSIVLNEETTSLTGTEAEIMVTAVHVHLSAGVDIFLGHVEADIATAPVPEPGSLMLLGVAALGILGWRWAQRSAASGISKR
jgi:PEP-CTERM motif